MDLQHHHMITEEAAMITLFAEYGARVRLTGPTDYRDGTLGTIVSDGTVGGLAIVQLDEASEPHVFTVDEFDVTLTPSDSAYRLTQRRCVDEVLSTLVDLAEIGASANITTYTSAVVFELYRLNHHAEQEVAAS